MPLVAQLTFYIRHVSGQGLALGHWLLGMLFLNALAILKLRKAKHDLAQNLHKIATTDTMHISQKVKPSATNKEAE